MAASLSDLKRWLFAGQGKGNSHMVVFCDTHGASFPTYVPEGKDVHDFINEYRQKYGDALRLMECYSYRMDLDAQLRQHRAFNF